MGVWFGKGWAQPVVSKRWAFVATVTEWIKRGTNYRWAWPTHAHHRAWERACGLR